MSEAKEVRRLAPEFLRVVHEIGLGQSTPTVSVYQVAEHLEHESFVAPSFDSPESLTDVAQYLGTRGLLKQQVYGWEGFSITKEGIDEMEGRNEPPPSITNFNFSGNNLYNAVIGNDNTANFTGEFDFSTVYEKIETQADDKDKQELRQLLAEVRELLENGQTLDKGFLARWNDKLQKYGWLSSAVAGWLLNFGTQSIAGG